MSAGYTRDTVKTQDAERGGTRRGSGGSGGGGGGQGGRVGGQVALLFATSDKILSERSRRSSGKK